MDNFNKFVNLNPQNILRNLNPQQIQSAANALWDSANQYVMNSIPSFNLSFRESIVLLMDISPEVRLFLEHEAKCELDAIIRQKRCKIDLNVSTNFSSVMDNCQISITGPPKGVHDSYLEIRQLYPITVWFDLKLNPNLRSIVLDPNAEPLQEIQKRHKIAICVVPLQNSTYQPMPSNHISIYIRTNRFNEEKLKSGIEELSKFIESHKYGDIYPKIQTKIDVPTTQPTIIGRTYSFLDPLAAKTSTQISVQKSPSNSMSNVSIMGHNYASISSARSEISDRFVVDLMFNVNGYQSKVLENFSQQLERMGEEFGVSILLKPNSNPSNKTMIIKGTDREVTKLFEVRQHIVRMIESSPFNTNNNKRGQFVH